ncbi:MAG: hypothetical protein IKZ54_09575 [Bacteroidales bacterium]|nr:hypothetical protein [Bacteroidales bacterium]
MQTYNQSDQGNVMPLLMNFTTPSPIQEYTPPIFNYDDNNQFSYEMRTVGTRSLKMFWTSKGGKGYQDKKNEIDDSKSVR